MCVCVCVVIFVNVRACVVICALWLCAGIYETLLCEQKGGSYNYLVLLNFSLCKGDNLLLLLLECKNLKQNEAQSARAESTQKEVN